MKFNEIIKRKGFFAALSGAIVLILQGCGLNISAPVVNEALTAVSAILVVVGAISLADKKAIDAELGEWKDEDDEDGDDGEGV